MDSQTDSTVQDTQEDEVQIELLTINPVEDVADITNALIESTQDDITNTSRDEDVDNNSNASDRNDSESQSISNSQNTENAYEKFHLGLVQTLIYKFSGNIKKAVMITIITGILICSFDTTSDLGLCIFYLTQGLGLLAGAVLLCDYVPGLIAFAHHYGTNDWQQSTLKEKILIVCALMLQPFSLLITNLIWALDIESQWKHKLARLSTILHGCMEAPMQFVLLLSAYSWAILPLPWMQSTSIIDENENILYLGQMTVVAFAFTCLGIVKGSVESFEVYSTEDQLLAMIWALFHLSFRLMSMVFLIIVLGIFSAPLFMINLVVNYSVLLKNDKLTTQWASTISSLAVSFFLPTWITKDPQSFQIRHKMNEEETKAEEERQRNESIGRKKVSFTLAMAVNPIMMAFNITAFILLKHTEYVQSTVWTNNQLHQFFLYMLLPLFCLTIVVSLGFSHYFEKADEDNNIENNDENAQELLKDKYLTYENCKNIKRFLSIFCLFGIVGSAIGFGIVVEKLNRSTIIAVNSRNELTAVQFISKETLEGCNTSSSIMMCRNLTFSSSNFRTAKLQDNVAYVDALPKQLKAPNDIEMLSEKQNLYYSLYDIILWNKYAPKPLTESEPHCKKCLYPSRLCDQAIEFITGIDRCDGKGINF